MTTNVERGEIKNEKKIIDSFDLFNLVCLFVFIVVSNKIKRI